MNMIDLGAFSKYRTELMGMAAILIILCHMPAHGVAMPKVLSMILSHGGAGCDMFLFLSGLGMYRSFCSMKQTGGGILKWYKKRFSRLLVPYLLICGPLFGIFAVRGGWSIGQYLLRLSTLSFWTEGWGLWFVALIIVLYLVTPLLDLMITGKRKWAVMVALIVVTWLSGSFPVTDGVATHVQFAVCRVPCFLLGYGLASEIIADKPFRFWYVLAGTAGLYVLVQMINSFTPMSLSVFWIEGGVLLLVFACVLNHAKRFAHLSEGLRLMGTISLESYCTNVFLLSFFLYLPWSFGEVNLNPGNWTYYLLGTLCCICVSFVVNRLSKLIIKKIVK